MTQFEQLDTILEGQHGMLQTSEVVKRGIPKSVFYNYVKEKELEQAAHGVYVSPDAWVDGMYLLHLRCSQGIFSHETALFFHDLTDREPSPYSITVRRGYSTTRLKADGILVYTIKPELHDVGKSTARTPFGHTVPAYDMERTICDLLRCRSSIEMQTFQGALKMYARRKEKNLRRLMQYAGLFRVEKFCGSIWRCYYDKDSKAAERFDPQSRKGEIGGRTDFDAELYDGAFPGTYFPF